MSNEFKPKLSLSQEMFSSFALHRKEDKNKINTDPGSFYEVFRNGTTAVEVIVKDVGNRQKKNDINLLEIKSLQDEIKSLRSQVNKPTKVNNEESLKTLQEQVGKLKKDLNEASFTLNKTKINFNVILQGMKMQLDIANQRELEEQTKNITLQLENEKLATLLTSKTNLANKFKEELANLKRALKFVIKNINYAPKIPEIMDDYKVFEADLKRQARINNTYDGATTFDSSVSKDGKSSFG